MLPHNHLLKFLRRCAGPYVPNEHVAMPAEPPHLCCDAPSLGSAQFVTCVLLDQKCGSLSVSHSAVAIRMPPGLNLIGPLEDLMLNRFKHCPRDFSFRGKRVAVLRVGKIRRWFLISGKLSNTQRSTSKGFMESRSHKKNGGLRHRGRSIHGYVVPALFVGDPLSGFITTANRLRAT